MIGATMCSGIGAPEMAAPWVDWRMASEIEKFPRAVLQQRFGYKPPADHSQGEPLLWGDMTEITPDLMRRHGIPLPDLIVAGTPCQAFSVAGLRNGVADDHGKLTLKFVETCHAIVDARPDGKLAVLWENVPGVLSDKGNAFGCFLAGIVGADDAFRTPDGESWPGVGMVEGPRARAAWRVLDAKHFGVPQRRRRVFVVVDFGNALDPAAVLFERKSMSGNPAQGEEAGQDVAPTISARNKGGGGLGTDVECDGGLIASTGEKWPAKLAPTLNSHFGDKMGLEDQHALNGAGLFVPAYAHSLKAEGYDASEDGTGRGTPIVPVAYSIMPQNSGKDYKARAVNVSQPLMAGGPAGGPVGGNQGGDFICQPVSFDCMGTEVQTDTSGVSPQLRAMGGLNGRGAGAGHSALAFDMNQITSPKNRSNPTPQLHHTLPATALAPHLADPWSVRRLMPSECHRLQGFPVDHCAITYRNKPAADRTQYKALGNSMAVPVVKWIMDRMKVSMEAA